MTPRRTLTFVIIALVLGAALALAVVLIGSPAGTQATAQAVTPAPGVTTDAQAQDATGTDDSDADPATADPARQEPVLDSFTAKDPFVPLASTGGSPDGDDTPDDGDDATDDGGGGAVTAYKAKVVINGSTSTVQKGDKVPARNPAFLISAVTSGDVTFKVIGDRLMNGDTSLVVNQGEKAEVKLKSGASYTIKVSSISKVGASGGVKGHSISVRSIATQGGKAVATLEVDGKTYPDKAVGDVIDTSWGQIKILAIDTGAQTVTIMHGDQTIVIHAGQVIVK